MMNLENRRRNSAPGVLVGIVTNIEDPKKLGRVKVKIPLWGDNAETDWCRIAVPMTGNGYGTLFVPEVGDEVLLAFHLNDSRQAYIIGGLWNEQHKPPEGGEKNAIRKIRSRSGHELIFDDTSGKGKVQLKTAKENLLELDDESSVIKVSDKSGDYKLELDMNSRKVTIKGGQSTITLEQTGAIKISGQQSITLEATEINLKANASMSIKANANLQIESSGMLEIKGSMVKIN